MTRLEDLAAPRQTGLDLAALTLLGVRFVQGFIFWGGATRRLIYDFHAVDGVDLATKLDFSGPGFVAAKLTHALPGALWVQGPIEWTLRHPDLILASVWLWTIAELAVGVGLMAGLFTRASALASVGLNVVLMAIFGWMGSTCLDEWTMAVSGVAMSTALFIAGGGAWSLDRRLFGESAWAERHPSLNWLTSGPLPEATLRSLAIWLAAGSIAFTLLTYQILFGAVVSPLHARVTFHRHHVALSDIAVTPDGGVRFSAYVDAGPDTGAAYIIAARLVDASGATVATWDGATLAKLPPETIRNAYPYAWASRFKTEKIGFSGNSGARAEITLPPPTAGSVPAESRLELVLEAIDGTAWRAALRR
jgi:thiosulfate dehydrogenase [quinone] large subunit